MKRRSFLAALIAAPVTAAAARFLPPQRGDRAISYYDWAEAVGRDLYRADVRAYEAQLEAITGGIPVQRFIAEQEAKSVALLREIGATLNEHLQRRAA